MTKAEGDTFLILCEPDAAERLEEILATEGHAVRVSPASLRDQLDSGRATGLFVDLASLTGGAAEAMCSLVASQPIWSDLPVLVIAARQEAAEHEELLAGLGQVRLIEPPLDPLLIRRAAASAARSRHRQRAALKELRDKDVVGGAYRDMAAELEHRIQQRMADLQTAHGQLRESEERYRQALELSKQTMWIIDARGNVQFMSDRYEMVVARPAQSARQLGWLQVIHPDDRDQLLAEWRRCAAANEPYYQEFRVRQADGSYRLFASRAAPSPLNGAGEKLWYGISEDIEDRQSTVRALQRTEERYRLAARATNDIIWDWEIGPGRMSWSDAAWPFFAGPIAETPFDWWADRIHPLDRDDVVNSLLSAMRSGLSRWEASYRFRRADGKYADIFDRGFIARDEHNQAVRAVGAMSDETRRREAEAQLQRVQAELIHVSRVSAMGAMASTLAHELNQPLTAVANYIHGSRRLLAEEDAETIKSIEHVLGALTSAEAGALRAGQIVRRLRELVSRGQVTAEVQSLERLIAEAGEIAFVDAHLFGIRYHVEVAEGAALVEVDRIQIQQVLINLIRNAVQALADWPLREIGIAARPAAYDMVEITVADTGPGLSAERSAALFTPFNSGKPDGMGIGLSICRTIVEAHGGKIWADPAGKGGATFRFTIPSAVGRGRARLALQGADATAYVNAGTD